MKLRITIILFILATSCSSLYSQNEYQSSLLVNRAVLRHFPGQELAKMQTQDSVKFNQIKYYFTQSFNVEIANCDSCEVDYNKLFNRDLFNITEFESLRQLNSNYTFLFKKNYQITLLSKQVTETQMDGLPTTSVLNLKIFEKFPEWIDTGNGQTDYKNYKRAIDKWSRKFPQNYREMTNNSALLKISISEFLALPQNKKNTVLSNNDGYLIID